MSALDSIFNNPQVLEQLFKAFKKGEAPEKAMQSVQTLITPNSEIRMLDSPTPAPMTTRSSRTDYPVIAPAQMDALWNRTNYQQPESERPDYDTTLMPRRAEHDVTYSRGVDEAFAEHGKPYEASTMDKILKYGGLAAAGLGAAGVGNKNTRKVLGLAGGAAIGHAGNAPARYYDKHRRLLDTDLMRLAAQRDESLAPLDAERQVYGDRYGRWRDIDDSRLNWNRIGLGAAGTMESANARAGGGGGGKDDRVKYKRAILAKQQEFYLNNGYFPQTTKNLYPDKSDEEIYRELERLSLSIEQDPISVGGIRFNPGALGGEGGITPDDLLNIPDKPSDADVRRGRTDLGNRKVEQAQKVHAAIPLGAGRDYDVLAGDWPTDSDDYVQAPEDSTVLNDLIQRGRYGDLMTPTARERLGGFWFDKDSTEANKDLISGADSLKTLMALGGGDPDLAVTEFMSMFPENYGQHPAQTGARREQLKAFLPQSPESYSEEWGFESVQAARADLESKKSRIAPGEYQKYRKMLGY